jgi:hypothetical protein
MHTRREMESQPTAARVLVFEDQQWKDSGQVHRNRLPGMGLRTHTSPGRV